MGWGCLSESVKKESLSRKKIFFQILLNKVLKNLEKLYDVKANKNKSK